MDIWIKREYTLAKGVGKAPFLEYLRCHTEQTYAGQLQVGGDMQQLCLIHFDCTSLQCISMIKNHTDV